MVSFNGTEIAEYKLLTHNIFFSIFFIIGMALTVIAIVTVKSNFSKEKIKQINELKKRAQSDNLAKKRLEKLERKARRKKKQMIADLAFESFLLALCVGIAIASLIVGVIPGWTDYIKKDYVVYNGTIEVCRNGKHSYILLEDGTKIDGHTGFSYDDKSGTVVYSRRSKVTLGGKGDF